MVVKETSLVDRLQLVDQIVTCTNCELHEGCLCPVPFSGTPDNSITVLAQNPGKVEDEKGEPLVGPSGQLLRRCLTGAGFNPQEISYVNTYSCRYDEAPKPEHIQACSANKWAQLDYLDPEWTIIAGNVALQSMIPHVKISRMRGRPFKVGRFKCFAIYHPSAALRNGNYEQAIEEDLETFQQIVAAPDWMTYISDYCIECSGSAVWVEDSGLGWCANHVPEEYHARQKFLERELEKASG